MQSTRDLRPYVKIGLSLDSTPEASSGANVCLLGFVDDIANLETGVAINEPIDLGVITSVEQAAVKLKNLGIKFSLTSRTSVDLDTTDEIGAMVLQAAMTVEGWQPYLAFNQLNSPRFYIGILDKTANDRDGTLSGGAFGGFFTSALDDELSFTTITHSYELQSDDALLSTGYMGIIKGYVDAVDAKGNPSLGLNYPIFHVNLPKGSDFSSVGYANIVKSSTVNTYQDLSSTRYQITSPMVASIAATVVAALPYSCRGLVHQTVPALPTPEVEGYFTVDDQSNMLGNGISPFIYNKATQTQQFSRVVTSMLLDENLGLARSNMLDMQDWKVVYESRIRIYNAIVFNKAIINAKARIAGGSIAPVSKTRKVILGELIRLWNEGLIIEPSEGFASTIDASLDVNNVSKILLSIAVYPSSILYQVSGTVVASDPAVEYLNFAIQLGA